MRIDLTDVLKEVGNELHVKEKVPVDYPKDEIDIAGPVDVDLDFMNIQGSVLAKGRIKADVKLECSRCLREFILPVEADIEEQFRREVPERPGTEVELKEDDFVFPIGEGNKIDISELMRQELIASLPMKALCSKDCKVIDGSSQGTKRIDPRLAKLKDLMK